MRLPIPMLMLACGGCTVVDAPEALEELVRFGFVHFGDDHAVEAATELHPLTAEHAVELAEGYRVSDLTHEHLVEAGIEAEAPDPVVGVSATVGMRSTLDEFAFAWSYPRLQDVLDGTIDVRIDREEGDRGCFVDGDCAFYAYEAWRLNDLGFLGTSAQDFRREFRWLELDDASATRVMLTREVVPEPAEMTGGLLRVDQQYAYTMVFEGDAGLVRMDTFWVDAEVIGADLPDYFALDTAVDSMERTAAQIDAFVAEQQAPAGTGVR